MTIKEMDHLPLPTPPLSRASSENQLGIENLAFENARNRKISASYAETGPVRKKSNIHKLEESENQLSKPSSENDSSRIDRVKKYSNASTVNSKTQSSVVDNERTWWYTFCTKCGSVETGKPSWHPMWWPKLCPSPYFPSYRTVSRALALGVIGISTWCILYAIVGEEAAPPDGRLFQLIVLSICAHFGGLLMGLTTLPALVGMLFTGIFLQNMNIVDINGSFTDISKHLSDISLMIILTRAGLDLDPQALKKLKYTVLKLSILPWITEALVVVLLAKYVLGMNWQYSLLLGSIIAAVAPAVVVPCLFRLRSKGYGVAKGIPTLIIAVASIDDATSVALFGILKGVFFSEDASLTNVAIFGPMSVFGGIAFGAIWGFLCKYAPERNDPFLVPLRVLLLVVGNMGAVFGSEKLGYGGAGPMACVTASFVAIFFWSKQGWDVDDNPAATAFEIFWMIFQPILFGITGARVRISTLSGSSVFLCLGILTAGVTIRMAVTVLIGIGCKLNLKEKIFVSVAWMCKAIVQAALGSVVVSINPDANADELDYAQKILTTCILSIILTAPLGAFLTTTLGPFLLTKTKITPLAEMRMRKKSRQLSFRDMAITDDEINAERARNGPENTHKITVVVEEVDSQ